MSDNKRWGKKRGCIAKELIFLDTGIHCRKGMRKFPLPRPLFFGADLRLPAPAGLGQDAASLWAPWAAEPGARRGPALRPARAAAPAAAVPLGEALRGSGLRQIRQSATCTWPAAVPTGSSVSDARADTAQRSAEKTSRLADPAQFPPLNPKAWVNFGTPAPAT